jgi:4-hydroxy 2-oxovalerate aldolase
MTEILISDPTLRDGNHAVQHQIDEKQIAAYCRAADAAGIPIVEVGHGNGLGASSLQLGQSLVPDQRMVEIARECLSRSRLGVFMIAGFGTINKDLRPAIQMGADVVRVGCHCTEADTTKTHIAFAREQGKEAYGCLMMSHMADGKTIAVECRKMESYGAQGVVLMDSAGANLPDEVLEKFKILSNEVGIPVGYHAHNNLGMAIANSLAALRGGGRILDGTARGFGAGAGNAQLEVLVGVLEKLGYVTHIDLYKVLDLSDIAEKQVMKQVPFIRPTSIVSGMAGVVSTMSKPVDRISQQYGVDPRDLFFELGKKKVVAGQEDIIIEVAVMLAERRQKQQAEES